VTGKGPRFEPAVAAVLADLTDSEFVRAPTGVRARPCRCEGGPMPTRDDRELGLRCLRCGRRIEEVKP
jgi:hypothetical protein